MGGKLSMYEKINIELTNAKEKLRRKQKFQNLVTQTNEALQKELNRRAELKNILDNEDKDVKKLEKFSITNIFYSILGSKEQQLEKERQELLSAKLKHDECCKSVSALERDLELYKESFNSLLGADYEYENVLKQKEMFILSLNDDNSKKLHELMDDQTNLAAQKKELEEAIASGEAAQIELEHVLDSLDRAEDWGTWDMIGGGLLATAAKHDHIDDAKEYAHYAKIALIRFQSELSDVDLTTDIDINIGSFETFADYFFDGLISDWIVQSRIRESLDCVQHAAYNVDSIISSLKNRLISVENSLLSIKESIKMLLEGV